MGLWVRMTDWLRRRTRRREFARALQFLLKIEGGYVNDPHDSGGETNFGISKQAYPDEDIAGMTKARAGELYYRDYWLPAGCNPLPFDMALCVFDAAVNCGVGKAKRWLMLCEGVPMKYLALREKYYYTLVKRKPPKKRYLKGWLNRLTAVRKEIGI